MLGYLFLLTNNNTGVTVLLRDTRSGIFIAKIKNKNIIGILSPTLVKYIILYQANN
jgi:hypothetical protein